MKFILNESTDIYFNLALEEYVLNELRDDSYFLLWKNETCIVVGKYQNIFEETNCREIEKRGVAAARRNTGGGTVFHDKGNLNYSFIAHYDSSTYGGYDELINPIIEVLKGLGVPACKRNICDIAVGDKKVSGSAQTISRQRILHHGTLLFDADLKSLHDLLRPSEGTFESKGIKSVRSEVANIKDFVADRSMSIDGFENAILQSLFPDGPVERRLTDREKEIISEIAKTKYKTWEWNYGASPKFVFHRESLFKGSKISVRLAVEKGIIRECSLHGEGLPAENIQTILLDQRYSYRILSQRLNKIKGFEEIVEYLF